jgi:hypothetical protein
MFDHNTPWRSALLDGNEICAPEWTTIRSRLEWLLHFSPLVTCQMQFRLSSGQPKDESLTSSSGGSRGEQVLIPRERQANHDATDSERREFEPRVVAATSGGGGGCGGGAPKPNSAQKKLVLAPRLQFQLETPTRSRDRPEAAIVSGSFGGRNGLQ